MRSAWTRSGAVAMPSSPVTASAFSHLSTRGWRNAGSLTGPGPLEVDLSRSSGDNRAVPSDLPTWFPPPSIADANLDAHLAAGGSLPDVLCPVCGWRGSLGGFTDNVRESGHCPGCGAWTRIRAMAAVLLAVWHEAGEGSASSVAELVGGSHLRIYNTEAHGVLHGLLSGLPGYVASEYFGPQYRSGDAGPGGVRHEDLQQLSFPADSFDLVLSTDVFEHVADPYRAHSEVRRVLRPGGHHVFTVPYDEQSLVDDVRARVGPDGTVELHAEPLYHEDPVRPDEGALVFTIFGLEMLVELAKIGLVTTVYRLWDPGRGIVGGSGTVFDAVKPH